MAIYVDTYKCHLCQESVQVAHTGKPTRANFDESLIFANEDGEGLHVCWECESERMAYPDED